MPLPDGLIAKAECKLQESSYPADRFFDLRMGMKLDEDRWASEANANYKMETLLRHSVFDFTMQVNDRMANTSSARRSISSGCRKSRLGAARRAWSVTGVERAQSWVPVFRFAKTGMTNRG